MADANPVADPRRDTCSSSFRPVSLDRATSSFEIKNCHEDAWLRPRLNPSGLLS